MSPLRSVGGRLALALLVVVAGALAIVYVIVVPSYRRSLVERRAQQLRTRSRCAAKRAARRASVLADGRRAGRGERSPTTPSAGVVVFSAAAVLDSVPPFADSNRGTVDSTSSDDPIAGAARRDRAPAAAAP